MDLERKTFPCFVTTNFRIIICNDLDSSESSVILECILAQLFSSFLKILKNQWKKSKIIKRWYKTWFYQNLQSSSDIY